MEGWMMMATVNQHQHHHRRLIGHLARVCLFWRCKIVLFGLPNIRIGDGLDEDLECISIDVLLNHRRCHISFWLNLVS